MHNLKPIRKTLEMTQTEMAVVLGCTQGNVGFLERGQMLHPEQAKALQTFALSRGWTLTLDHIYAVETLPAFVKPATQEA